MRLAVVPFKLAAAIEVNRIHGRGEVSFQMVGGSLGAIILAFELFSDLLSSCSCFCWKKFVEYK